MKYFYIELTLRLVSGVMLGKYHCLRQLGVEVVNQKEGTV